MKAMWLAFAAIGVIALISGLVLGNLQYSTADRHATENVRLR